ncbi:MAG: hypothetical protein V3571_02560 [Pseudodesulfovibrio sp.]
MAAMKPDGVCRSCAEFGGDACGFGPDDGDDIAAGFDCRDDRLVFRGLRSGDGPKVDTVNGNTIIPCGDTRRTLPPGQRAWVVRGE